MNLSLFKNKNFSLLVSAKFISTVGTFIQSTAFGLYIIDKTQDSMLFAAILIATLIPKVILSPICGVFVDWANRKKMLMILDLISGAILLASSAFLGNDISVFEICLIMGSLGIINAFDEPAAIAILPSIIPKNELESANALNMISTALGNILGPVLGVAIYTSFGIHYALIFNGISFIAGALMEAIMKVDEQIDKDRTKNLRAFARDFSDGIKFIMSHKRMRLITLCIFVQNFFFNGASTVGIPFISRTVFKVSDGEFALIQITVILGAILGILLSGVIRKGKTGDKMFSQMLTVISFSFLFIGVATIGIFQSYSIAFYAVLLFNTILGISSINVTVTFQSEMQREIDSGFLGRISSIVIALIMSSIPMGQAFFGWLFNWMYPSVPYLITFAVILLVAMVYKFSSRSIKGEGIISEEEASLNNESETHNENNADSNPEAEKLIEKMKYDEMGNKDADTIIFIHACGISSWMWYEQKDYFSDYRCIFLDLPEHGINLSVKPFTMETAVEIVSDIIKKCSADGNVILIGHEMGARVVLATLQKYSHLIDKAVVSGLSLRSGREAVLHKIMPKGIIVNEFNKKYKKLQSKEFQIIAREAYGVNEENHEFYLKDVLQYSPVELIRLLKNGLVKKLNIKGLKNITVPTLVLSGDKEIKQNIKSSEDLVKLMPNCKKYVIEGANENLIRVFSEVYNVTVRDFLEQDIVDNRKKVKKEGKLTVNK